MLSNYITLHGTINIKKALFILLYILSEILFTFCLLCLFGLSVSLQLFLLSLPVIMHIFPTARNRNVSHAPLGINTRQ
jgi:hypothetical protein